MIIYIYIYIYTFIHIFMYTCVYIISGRGIWSRRVQRRGHLSACVLKSSPVENNVAVHMGDVNYEQMLCTFVHVESVPSRIMSIRIERARQANKVDPARARARYAPAQLGLGQGSGPGFLARTVIAAAGRRAGEISRAGASSL